MPELDTITIKGFKSIAAIEALKLGPINIVIGANGSGKSNFIEVFDFLHAIRVGRLQSYVGKAGGAERLLHFGSKVTSELDIQLSFRGGENSYEIALDPTEKDELLPVLEYLRYPHELAPQGVARIQVSRDGMEAGISVPDTYKEFINIQALLRSWRVYHFHDTSSSSPMKKTADVDDNRYLRPDGSNVAAFLYFLREKHSASYSLIVRTVQSVAPFFDDFMLEPQQLNLDKIRLEWRHQGSEAYFDASSLSDGTLRFIALATLFLQPEALRPSVILVDEPELGLHPYAITLLASLIKQASVTTQVIVSTQSSLLLDHFQPEDVLVADRVNGATQLTRLDSKDLASWLEDYGLGQLWEKNELGGRPTSEAKNGQATHPR